MNDMNRGPFEEGRLPVGQSIADAVDFLLANLEGSFSAVAVTIDWITRGFEGALLWIPPWLFTLLICGVSAWRVGIGQAAFSSVALAVVVGMDLWHETIATLALVLSATFVSLVVGLPLGVLSAKGDRLDRVVRPVLDLMQTMPAFVYLIPAAMFFGLGRVPGAIATIIFSMPPAVRLTNLGIRQVPRELVEAGMAFGCTRMQLLRKVQLPQALPSIMAGVNQNIMLALSMVVIASMIGAGGLGNEVLRGIQRLDVGLGFEGGIGVVVLAIILDRITQSFGQQKRRGAFEQFKETFGVLGGAK